MKTRHLSTSLLLVTVLAVLLGCDPKNDPRWVNEGAKTWTPVQTVDREDIPDTSFSAFDLDKAYTQLQDGKSDLTATILKPLSLIVLNKKFIGTPSYRTLRLSQMISVFNSALIQEWPTKNHTKDFEVIKTAYYAAVFADCNRDLRSQSCTNAGLFSDDGRHTAVMTLFARDEDSIIDAQLKANGGSPQKCIDNSADCRNALEERYRRLAMGVFKRNRNPNSDFAFAYVKYARMFSMEMDYVQKHARAQGSSDGSMSYSYLAQVHGNIFETLIGTYQPKDLGDAEFRAFVENYNPWGFSHKQADIFQYGTSVMFQLASKCCLYQDAAKTQLSKSVKAAIETAQLDGDSYSTESFRQMIADIDKAYPQGSLFKNLGVFDQVSYIVRPGSPFYNEYFFMVDRLFRGHLNTDEVEMMLQNTDPKRTRVELPKMVAAYVRINLIDLIVETNRFMNDIYNHSNLASDQIFEQAVVRSRELTGRWYTMQAQTDLLDKLLRSYFKDQIGTSKEYDETFALLQGLSRNIHYLSVYPNMIVMNYFLAQMKGSFTINTWFGAIKIDADTVLQSFFDGGVNSPWFRFGKDTIDLDRQTLLYGLQYLLSTESLQTFSDPNLKTQGTDRKTFFNLLFSKYLGDSVDDLRKSLIAYQRTTLGSPDFAVAKQVCDYEMNPKLGPAPRLSINFLNLDRYTYTGLGDNGLNSVLAAFLSGPSTAAGKLLAQVDVRRTYVRAMARVIEQGDPKNPDAEKARDLLAQLDDIQTQFSQTFVAGHKYFFDCANRLREVERRRANRLYDEERAWLDIVFTNMIPLAAITDDKALDAKASEITKTLLQAKGAKFDRIEGLNYRLSKYDQLMRIKAAVESDIFSSPSPKETTNYPDLRDYLKPRSVSIYLPDGLVRDEMYAQGTNTTITLHGTTDADREDFIRQGLATMNGKESAFIRWQDQYQSDLSFQMYLSALESFYLLPPVAATPGKPAVPIVSAEDLTNAYIKIVAGYTMDPYDVEYAKVFGLDGRNPKEFLLGKLFDNDGSTPLPLFFALMTDVYKAAQVDPNDAGPVAEALDFAKKFNSMQAFVFPPPSFVKDSVHDIYGDRANDRLIKVRDLFQLLDDKENDKKVQSASDLDPIAGPRLVRPVFFEGDQYVSWVQNGVKHLVDPNRVRDGKIQVFDFSQSSGDFYQTKEKVKVQWAD